MKSFVSHPHWWNRRRVGIGLGIALLWATPSMAQFTRVSVGVGGAVPDGHSGLERPLLSADGRYVAFISDATNLVSGDTNATVDVFIRDLQAPATTTRVSVANDGSQIAGHSNLVGFSANGRVVLFITDGTVVGTDTNLCSFNTRHCLDLYARDLDTNTTTRIGKTAGTQPNQDTQLIADISADGRYVTFMLVGDGQIYVHDRVSGQSIGIGPDFPGRDDYYFGGSISEDGHTIVFNGATPPDVAVPPTQQCPGCVIAVYIYNRDTATYTTIVPDLDTLHLDKLDAPAGAQLGLYLALLKDVSANGRYVLVEQRANDLLDPDPQIPYTRAVLYDRQTGRADFTPWRKRRQIDSMSSDARYFVWVESVFPAPTRVVLEDRLSGLVDQIDNLTLGVRGVGLSRDARLVSFATMEKVLPEDTDDLYDAYVFDRDGDDDHLPNRWETTFGLDPALASDAGQDADGDGLTNLQEHQQGTHPRGSSTRYFAEGAVNAFFRTRFALVNPNATPATVVLHYLGSSGHTSSTLHTLAARSRATVDYEFFGPDGEADFSTVVESDQPVVADRTMSWGASNYGSHAETSIASPATTWYLAEGATHGAFDLFYLLQNPTSLEANVTIEYLRPAPAAPVVKQHVIDPHSRRTIYVDLEGPELAETDVAATITSTQPVIVERAMYASTPSQPFAVGHDGAGVTAPATRWFLAEGSTGDFFDEYVLIGNPGARAAQLSVTYLLPSGESFSKPYTVNARSRLTIAVDGEDARLANTPVSVIVESTNSEPVVVERAMWWPSPLWHEAHLSHGSTETGTRWAVAEGEIGIDAASTGYTDTYILIANTSNRVGAATVTLLVEGGTEVTQSVPLAANSRTNVQVSTLFPRNASRRFGAIVESDGVEIVVERAMYTTVGLLPWTSGTDALATKLP